MKTVNYLIRKAKKTGSSYVRPCLSPYLRNIAPIVRYGPSLRLHATLPAKDPAYPQAVGGSQ